MSGKGAFFVHDIDSGTLDPAWSHPHSQSQGAANGPAASHAALSAAARRKAKLNRTVPMDGLHQVGRSVFHTVWSGGECMVSAVVPGPHSCGSTMKCVQP